MSSSQKAGVGARAHSGRFLLEALDSPAGPPGACSAGGHSPGWIATQEMPSLAKAMSEKRVTVG